MHLSFSFVQYIKNKIPPGFRAEFNRSLLLSSLYNIQLLSWMGFSFAFPLLLLDFLRFRSGEWDNSRMAPYIVLSHFSLLVLFFPALLARKYFKKVKSGFYNQWLPLFVPLYPVIIGILLYPNFVISLMTGGNIVLYAIFILTINVAVLLSHPQRIIFNVWIYGMLLAAATIIFWSRPPIILLIIIEATGVSLPAYLIATYQYNLRAQEFLTRKALNAATQRSESLLLNILPASVAAELKENGYYSPRLFKEVTILFADFKDFSIITQELSPEELVSELHACFSHFDQIMGQYGLEKIKTIGDAYLCVCGLPEEVPDHAYKVVQAGLAMQQFLDHRRHEKKAAGKRGFQARIGIHTGAVLAGVVGTQKYAYDIWGDAVNIAARCQEAAEVDSVNISKETYLQVNASFECLSRGNIAIKNLGEIEMYKVVGSIS